LKIAEAVQQRAWGWAAAANLNLGGVGAAFHLSALIAGGGRPDLPAAPFLVLAGFLLQTIETGRPLRGYKVLSSVLQPDGSWMSREVLLGVVFVIAGLTDWLFPHPLLTPITATAAAGFILAQGLLVYRARAVKAWTTRTVPVLLGSLSFMGGSGLLLAIGGQEPGQIQGPALLALIVLTVNGTVWHLHESTRPGRRRSGAGVGVWMGAHALCGTMAISVAALGAGRVVELLAGGLMIGTGVLLKTGLLRAGRMHPLDLSTVLAKRSGSEKASPGR
jgi:DMSO reductase anchor subunit